MRVVIAGGHGQIALRLEGLLAARGDEVVALIRNPAQADDVRAAGGRPVVVDLEEIDAAELAARLDGADAVVFAAGAGPGSGAARKDTVDRGAAVLLADAAQIAGVDRYLLVSSIGADQPGSSDTDDGFGAYLRAKAAAEQDLIGRPLKWTIVRPGALTNDPGTDQVHLSTHAARGSVTRDDVAAVLLDLLDHPRTAGLTVELIGGATPIRDAVGALLL
ncbi:MAG: SDR family oxidoreductase [Frankia sp.]